MPLHGGRRVCTAWTLAALIMASIMASSLAACRPQAEVAEAPAAEPSNAVLCVHSENNGALWLVQIESVANELQLAPDQREKFATWSREANLQSKRLLAAFRTGENPGSEQERTAAQQKSLQLVLDFHRQVVAALNARQVQRLDELFLQSLGPSVFFFPPLIDRLRVTEPQRLALREVRNQPDPSYEKLLEVLTPTQRTELERLQGQPFKFPTPKTINFLVE